MGKTDNTKKGTELNVKKSAQFIKMNKINAVSLTINLPFVCVCFFLKTRGYNKRQGA